MSYILNIMNMIPPNGVDENLWMYSRYFNRLKPGDNVQLKDGRAGTIIDVLPDHFTVRVALNDGQTIVCKKIDFVRVAQ